MYMYVNGGPKLQRPTGGWRRKRYIEPMNTMNTPGKASDETKSMAKQLEYLEAHPGIAIPIAGILLAAFAFFYVRGRSGFFGLPYLPSVTTSTYAPTLLALSYS